MSKFRKTFFITILCLILLIIILFIINKILLKKEELILSNYPGTMVNVNNHNMHVYSEGSGDKTLIFMAPSGETAPTYSFKKLYSKLSNYYRIVVIEKAGYGYSQIANVSRDIDTILEETRQALKLSNINGPYVLVPYSMSGIESLYWLQKYPEEIQGIISIDMAIPSSYTEDFTFVDEIMFSSLRFANNIGISRLPIFSNMLNDEFYSKEEIDKMKMLLYKNMYNKNIYNECKEIYNNAKKINLDDLDYSKFYIEFVTDNNENWIENHKEISEKFAYNTTYNIDCSHGQLIYKESDFISEKIRENLNIIHNKES